MSRRQSPSDLRREERRLRERIGVSSKQIDVVSTERRTQRAAGLRHDAARLDEALAASGSLYSAHRGLLAHDVDLLHRRAVGEKVALGKELEALERPKAKARQAATRAKAGEGTVGGGDSPPPGAGKTRDIVAKAVGTSGFTYSRATGAQR